MLRAVSVAHYVFQHRVAGGFGLVKSFEGRTSDPDRAPASINRTPRRHITGASVKALTSRAFMADHEGIALAACAPYFHVLDGTMELQGHCQSVCGHSIDQQVKRFIGDASSIFTRRKRPGQHLPSQSQKCHPAVALPNFNIMAARQVCRSPFRIVVIRASQIDGRPNVPILHQVCAIKQHDGSRCGTPWS